MPGPARPQPLASAIDAHGIAVTLDLDAPPLPAVDGGPLGVVLTLGRTSAMFDIADVEQRDGLVALRNALDRVLDAPERADESTQRPWKLNRLDREDETDAIIGLPDHLAAADNVMILDNERIRILWASDYSRTLFVRPEPLL